MCVNLNALCKKYLFCCFFGKKCDLIVKISNCSNKAPLEVMKGIGLLGRLARAAENHGVNSTFFLLSEIAKSCPEGVEEVYDFGHEIASHGYSHEDLTCVNKNDFEKMEKTNRGLLAKIIGHSPKGLRSPMFNTVTLYVKEGYCGRGIGGRMFEKLSDAARNQGFHFLTAAVVHQNRESLNLFSRFGCRVIKNSEKCNDVIIVCPLTMKGDLTCRFLRIACCVVPGEFLVQAAEWIIRRTTLK